MFCCSWGPVPATRHVALFVCGRGADAAGRGQWPRFLADLVYRLSRDGTCADNDTEVDADADAVWESTLTTRRQAIPPQAKQSVIMQMARTQEKWSIDVLYQRSSQLSSRASFALIMRFGARSWLGLKDEAAAAACAAEKPSGAARAGLTALAPASITVQSASSSARMAQRESSLGFSTGSC